MSKRFKKLSHSLYEHKYRIVFCPKRRYRIFRGEMGQYVHQQTECLLKQKGLVEVMKLNVQPDHVHFEWENIAATVGHPVYHQLRSIISL